MWKIYINKYRYWSLKFYIGWALNSTHHIHACIHTHVEHCVCMLLYSFGVANSNMWTYPMCSLLGNKWAAESFFFYWWATSSTIFFSFFCLLLICVLTQIRQKKDSLSQTHSYTYLSYIFVSWNLTRSVSCEHLAKVTNDQLTLSFIRHRLLTVSCAYQTLTDKKGFTLWNIWTLEAFRGLTLPK